MPQDKEARKRQRQEQQKAQRKHQKRQATRAFQEQQEVEGLEATIAAGAPAPGSNPLTYEEYVPGQYASARKFEDLPISAATKAALKGAKYNSMTAVQRATIPHALAGRDVLGAAKTGSGKTLAFLVPVRGKGGRVRHIPQLHAWRPSGGTCRSSSSSGTSSKQPAAAGQAVAPATAPASAMAAAGTPVAAAAAGNAAMMASHARHPHHGPVPMCTLQLWM